MFFDVVKPLETAERTRHLWSLPTLVGNVALNVAAFVATALLVSVASDKLREARADVERRKAEIARLQSLHGSVLTSMSSGVLTTDLDGGVTYANRAAQELLGAPSVDLVGRPLLGLGLVGEADWNRIAASGSEILRFENARRSQDGEEYFGISATALRDGSGYTIGRILIFQNLTELKRLEGEVRLKDKLAAVGEVAAGIAHEIRNPLASISGSVQVLKNSSSPGSPEQRLMEIVVAESHRLSTILEDFLRYVRPKEHAVEPVDAPAALDDVLTLLAHGDEISSRHRVVRDFDPPSVVVLGGPRPAPADLLERRAQRARRDARRRHARGLGTPSGKSLERLVRGRRPRDDGRRARTASSRPSPTAFPAAPGSASRSSTGSSRSTAA